MVDDGLLVLGEGGVLSWYDGSQLSMLLLVDGAIGLLFPYGSCFGVIIGQSWWGGGELAPFYLFLNLFCCRWGGDLELVSCPGLAIHKSPPLDLVGKSSLSLPLPPVCLFACLSICLSARLSAAPEQVLP